jgi:hypothetical protein
MRNVDATILAAVTNRCTDMMQEAAASYYVRDPDDRRYHAGKLLERFRELGDRLGFTVEEKKLEDAA